ncbi:DUF6366 family protein [Planococcus salinarum]|uniref:DUF6366 family protein n=1 Tax=Planococcus salinarum TaxID=622695 RepID=UPI003703C75D
MKEKWRNKEYKKNPMANFSDSINKTFTGDFSSLGNIGCFTSVILILICIMILYFNSN